MKAEKWVWIIRDKQGNFISFREMIRRKGWYHVIYSGIATGFSFYISTAKTTAEQHLKLLNDAGYTYFLDFVDINQIPKGARIDN